MPDIQLDVGPTLTHHRRVRGVDRRKLLGDRFDDVLRVHIENAPPH